MAELLILEQRVKNTIQLGESHFREFKSAWEGPPNQKKPGSVKNLCRYIGEALVAFANADGGELLIGVEDNGTISGIPHDEADIQKMLDAISTHVHRDSKLPLINSVTLNIDRQTILFFAVSKGIKEIYQLPDGRCVPRMDMSTIPATFQQITFERREVESREYDRQFVDGATVTDIDADLIQPIKDRYLPGLSLEGYLQQIGLAEYGISGLRLRRASLLLFAKNIQKWNPRCQVRILKVAGTELRSGEKYNVTSDETVLGNIFTLLRDGWEQLRPYLVYKTAFGMEARFEQQFVYPELACREALVNAIVHRDYNIQNGMDIYIFDDRLEIRNPGALLSTLTVQDLEDLQGAHESRNVYIAKILRENDYVRELGEGMRRIFELMEMNELTKPELHSNGLWFSVTLHNRSVYSLQQQRWQAQFSHFDLTANQQRVIALGIQGKEISAMDIQKAINTTDRNLYDEAVTPLRRLGILKRTKNQAMIKATAEEKGIQRKQVPRFEVQFPKTDGI